LTLAPRARLAAARHRKRIATAALATSALVYVAVADPHRAHRAQPRCPVKLLTGLDCPSCGGMRLAYDVLHGDAGAAVHDNPFLLACSPVLSALLWRGLAAQDRRVVPPTIASALAVSALAWMVVRNLRRWPLKPIVRR
jgi:hypothetical protein